MNENTKTRFEAKLTTPIVFYFHSRFFLHFEQMTMFERECHDMHQFCYKLASAHASTQTCVWYHFLVYSRGCQSSI